MNRAELRRWIDAYERAWRRRGTEQLGALFAGDATYRTAPFEQPFRGLAAIAEFWESERDGPDEPFAMDSEIVAVEADTGVVRVEVRYGDPVRQIYRDLWVVTLDRDGRCVAFEEWPFWPEGSAGSFASGPRTS